MKFQRCPGCKVEYPISNFTMALCLKCRKVETPLQTKYECVKAGVAPRYYASKRYARLKQATPPWVDQKAIKAFYDEARRLTKETGVPHEVDHIWPIVHESFSGLHVPWNLRVIPSPQNSSKRNTPPLAFYGESGYIA
jgi:hypothetical protein